MRTAGSRLLPPRLPVSGLAGVFVFVAVGTVLGAVFDVLVALPALVLVLAALVGFGVIAARAPEYWLALYFGAILLSPDPRFSFLGISASIHLGDLMFIAAVPIYLLTQPRLDTSLTRVALAFLGWSGISLVSSFIISGPAVGAASTLRWLRLVEACFPLFFALSRVPDARRALRLCETWLVVAALAASAYGVAQFYLGFDLSALGIQYADHLLWTEGQARLRAIGFFNEASGLGTMAALLIWICAFLLVSGTKRPTWFLILLLVCIPIATLALVLSFARAPIVGLIGALALLALQRGPRAFMASLGVLAVGAAIVAVAAPDWTRLLVDWRLLPGYGPEGGGVSGLLTGYSSGRLENWSSLLQRFLALPPIYFVIGIGYKSLPFSPLAVGPSSGPLVGDSQVITSLIEQGIVGLVLLALLAWRTLAGFLAGARVAHGVVRTWGTLMAIYWAAQILFQFPFIDYLTYFRLVPIIFGLCALVELGSEQRVGAAGTVQRPLRRLIVS